jgi:hypothetical protein
VVHASGVEDRSRDPGRLAKPASEKLPGPDRILSSPSGLHRAACTIVVRTYNAQEEQPHPQPPDVASSVIGQADLAHDALRLTRSRDERHVLVVQLGHSGFVQISFHYATLLVSENKAGAFLSQMVYLFISCALILMTEANRLLIASITIFPLPVCLDSKPPVDRSNFFRMQRQRRSDVSALAGYDIETFLGSSLDMNHAVIRSTT